MGLFKDYINKVNVRSEQNELERKIEDLFESYNDNSDKHVYVSEEGALSLAAVWACVRIISQAAGILPIKLYKKTNKGREEQREHVAHKLIQRPNEYTGRVSFIEFLLVSVLLYGNGYARIYKDKMQRPVRLKLVHPLALEPMLSNDDCLFYKTSKGEILDSSDIIHIKEISTNGIKGKSPIAVHRDNLSLTKAAEMYGEKFFLQGGNMSGVFEYPGKLDKEKYEILKNDMYRRYTGISKSHLPIVLEGGMKYNRISIPPEDAQFILTRKYQKTEVATIYGVPPHMIADLDRATNNNIEHQGMEFVTYCLMPYIGKIEEELNYKMLRYDEFTDYYFAFNLNALLRGDAKTRSEYYNNMHRVGAMTSNEIRRKEDMNEYDGGDTYFMEMNKQPVNIMIKNNGKETEGN